MYFPTLYPIQNIGFLNCSHGTVFHNHFHNCLHLFNTDYTCIFSLLQKSTRSLDICATPTPCTTDTYPTLFAHTPAYSLFSSNSLALLILMLSQCPAPPQPLNTIPKNPAVRIVALIAAADLKELGAQITILPYSHVAITRTISHASAVNWACLSRSNHFLRSQIGSTKCIRPAYKSCKDTLTPEAMATSRRCPAASLFGRPDRRRWTSSHEDFRPCI